MGTRIFWPDVYAGRPAYAVAGYPPHTEAADQRFFNAENIFFDEIARAP